MKLIERKPMIVESSPVCPDYTQQLLLLSKSEADEIRKQFPELNVREAENEDKANWAFSESLFNDPKGMPTSEMLVLPDEIQERMRRARKARNPSVISHLHSSVED